MLLCLLLLVLLLVPQGTAPGIEAIRLDEAAPCADTPLLVAAQLRGARPVTSSPHAPAATDVASCRAACCSESLCVAWTFAAASAPDKRCSLYATRGVLAETANGVTSASPSPPHRSGPCKR